MTRADSDADVLDWAAVYEERLEANRKLLGLNDEGDDELAGELTSEDYL